MTETETIEWEKADGLAALQELFPRILEGAEIIATFRAYGRFEVRGPAYLEAGCPSVAGFRLVDADAITATVAKPAAPAWADCKVVRDDEGECWTLGGGYFWWRGVRRDARRLADTYSPITPVIDADGRPILSDDDLGRAATAVVRVDGWGYYPILGALRDTLGGAR